MHIESAWYAAAEWKVLNVHRNILDEVAKLHSYYRFHTYTKAFPKVTKVASRMKNKNCTPFCQYVFYVLSQSSKS
jgi:pterin-4a-carbinolamine dehydratase